MEINDKESSEESQKVLNKEVSRGLDWSGSEEVSYGPDWSGSDRPLRSNNNSVKVNSDIFLFFR